MQRPILMDIFEPPPQWMYSQPSSLSDIAYQDLNSLSTHEDVYDDVMDIPKRYQSDNNSLTTSIYTAEEEEEENTRHGHLPSIETQQEDMIESIHTKMKDLNIQHTLSWEDYRPQYKILNASYDDMKLDIYSDIYVTLKKMQALDQKFNLIKAGFYFNMEKEYEAMSMRLLSQCEELSQQKEYQSKHTSQSKKDIYVWNGGLMSC
ncbi:uncharacterized protein B0P05DRAFT_552172 [Gilbertella persicaria]|uniref:uncharacterized protein n=1 Tax=Gilbertella persicaria TaxID=101096 RepID=UPI00221F84F8|nr:uncharacterized protein B0P05DRAFT_552172 [Gilbertella persicaria]KAI8068181.1 hypothetical protein B0P05DRAFT_552172 [Gilbertella persicaria]